MSISSIKRLKKGTIFYISNIIGLLKYSYLVKVSNDNKLSNHMIGIVAKETAVLRQWEIDKQELRLLII